MKEVEKITFFIQGKKYSVTAEDVTPSTSLNSYLRNTLQLTGTKGMCNEGGCGACVVVLHQKDASTQKDVYKAVNSCLVPMLSCNGWDIYTVEGIGDPLKGYHPIQEVLAKFNGTQCGFCSSGMVMNMYALYESGKLTMAEVENSFGGNICRCTGYRPILSAFKSLCTNSGRNVPKQFPDIEELKICKKGECKKWCGMKCPKIKRNPFLLKLADATWIKVYSLEELLNTLNTYAEASYKLVAGSTAKGVFSSYGGAVDVYIDVADVLELKSNQIKDGKFVLGANTTLTTTMEVFKQIADANTQFSYLNQLAKHIDLVANVPVRNVGTLAGNLIMKHDNHDFASDIFLILETVGAVLNVVQSTGDIVQLTPQSFIQNDMNLKVLKSIEFSSYPPETVKYISYKIMPRAQNSHAHINAGFLFKFNKAGSTLESANIVYGHINPTFIHAAQAEKILKDKNLFDSNTIQLVCASLDEELICSIIPLDPSPEFRKQLAIGLFYKAVLSIAPADAVLLKYQSGGSLLERPISSGVHDFQTNKLLYPLTQPVPKLEALNQTTGQAKYINDIPDVPHQLYASLILAEAPPNSTIKTIDSSAALAVTGIEGFYTANDIPGTNTFTPVSLFYGQEEIFCSGHVLYYHQPIGILVGINRGIVSNAAGSIKVTYDPPTLAPLTSVREVIKAGRTDRIKEIRTIPATKTGDDIKTIVSGTFDIYHQYHFHMETQNCNVVPTEDGLEINPGSQWMDQIQLAVASMLQIQQNKIYCKVRRLGGAFGAKISRNGLISCATALAAWKLRKPVKLSMSLKDNMQAIGKRFPLTADYELAVNDAGIIQYFYANLYCDLGSFANERPTGEIVNLFLGNYINDPFTVRINTVLTDTHPNTWTRAPGSCEGLASIEAMMEHAAVTIEMDPLEFRVANFVPDSPLLKYVEQLKSWANIDDRKQEIQTFNQENRWKKKGMAVVPMTYSLGVSGPFSVMVSIFHGDGSVQLSHGGIEVGQGINTKAAQVCAYKLGISLDKISVIPSNSFVAPNNTTTGGGVTSEAVCFGVIQACDVLNERIQPYKDQAPEASWEDIINLCFQKFVNLSATGVCMPIDPNFHGYLIYGITAVEIELDVLTGQHIITRVDLLEDTGQSMSPSIDIGQVEGAFTMGIGYHTLEKIEFNYEGRILTNNTWTYYPPGPKDIPVDFRVKFPKDNPNQLGVLNSKATAEPPLCMTIAVPLAIRNAVASARSDSNAFVGKWYPIDGPTTVENVFINSLNDYTQYVL